MNIHVFCCSSKCIYSNIVESDFLYKIIKIFEIITIKYTPPDYHYYYNRSNHFILYQNQLIFIVPIWFELYSIPLRAYFIYQSLFVNICICRARKSPLVWRKFSLKAWRSPTHATACYREEKAPLFLHLYIQSIIHSIPTPSFHASRNIQIIFSNSKL